MTWGFLGLLLLAGGVIVVLLRRAEKRRQARAELARLEAQHGQEGTGLMGPWDPKTDTSKRPPGQVL